MARRERFLRTFFHSVSLHARSAFLRSAGDLFRRAAMSDRVREGLGIGTGRRPPFSREQLGRAATRWFPHSGALPKAHSRSLRASLARSASDLSPFMARINRRPPWSAEAASAYPASFV